MAITSLKLWSLTTSILVGLHLWPRSSHLRRLTLVDSKSGKVASSRLMMLLLWIHLDNKSRTVANRRLIMG